MKYFPLRLALLLSMACSSRSRRLTASAVASILENLSDDDADKVAYSDSDSETGSSCDEYEELLPDLLNRSDDDSDDQSSELPGSEDIMHGRNGFTWSSRPPGPSSFRGHNITRVKPGITYAVRNCTEEIDFFRYVIDDTMRHFILNCTNKRIPDHEREITLEELDGYIAICLLLGVTKKRNIDISEIWNRNSCHFMEFCTLVLPRDRYRLISRFVTFDDIEEREAGSNSNDKFYKMRFVFDRFRSKIRTAFEPYSHVCVDEELYSFRGKCPFRQYLPSKPAKYGIKYFCINDVKTSYLLDAMPYLGKDSSSSSRAKNVGEQIVLDLGKPYFKTGRGITTDNFFSSISLNETLWKNGLTHIGTLRKNKGEIPPSFLPQRQREQFSSSFAFQRHMTLVSYVPSKSKAVILISSEHHSKSTERHDPKKPSIILAYNETKGAVDTFDKLIAGFSCRRYTKRWPKNCFFFMLDAAAFNSFVLLTEKNPTVLSKNAKIQRRILLEELAMKIAEEAIRQRVSSWQHNKFHGVNKEIRATATKFGYLEECAPNEVMDLVQHRSRSAGRCSICPRANDRKCRNTCTVCKRFVCKDHTELVCCLCSSK